MLSLTGTLITLCLALSPAMGQQPLIFASPSSSTQQAQQPQQPQQPRTAGVANERELIFSSNVANSNPAPLATPVASVFSASPNSFTNPPIFSSTGPTPAAASDFQRSFLEPRRFLQTKIGSQRAIDVQSRITSNIDSNLSTAETQPSMATQAGPPVFAKFTPSESVQSTIVQEQEENLKHLTKGAEKFALEFLRQISNEHLRVPNRSYMISPLSVWSLLMLLTEGAQANTLTELRKVLSLDNNTPTTLRSAYRQISKRLNAQTPAVEIATYQALFTDINKPVKRDYENIIEREYESVLTPVDFADVNSTFTKINDAVNKATRGLLPHSVLPQDLVDVELLMISSLYLKGKWTHPFDSANTHWVPFHDESGNVTGNIEMMTQSGYFTYTQMKELDCHILELPYGEANRTSMLILFPKRGVSVNAVVKALPNVGISTILKQLDEEKEYALHDGAAQEVEVFLPKFTTQSHFSLRYILENMGLIDVFQPAYANLTNISRDLYVSSIFQSTRIIVNEEGTEAAAVAVASLINKASPVRFYLDRPFAYMIVERTANLLLFAGEIKSHV